MASSRSSRAAGAALGELVRTLPARQLLLLWLAIFSTFATVACMLDIIIGGRLPIGWLTSIAVISGGLAVGFTVTSLRRQWIAFAVLVGIDVVYVVVARHAFALESVAPAGRLTWDAIGAMAGISLGYTMSILFMNATATRFLRARAELAIAHEIHQGLVPPIDRRVGEYEYFGWSIASGEVGGDLVDLVASDGRWLGYVADVSGHGVGPGIVMAMFKSALRIRTLAAGAIPGVLRDVQTTLIPLKQPNMYVTVACVQGGIGDELECAVAGHLPILRVRAGLVDEITTPQLALGMFDEAEFHAVRVDCHEGDLLAMLTDGLIEVFDASGRELGFEWAKATLAASATQPLAAIADRLLSGARRHGPQLDDQSLLLIRRRTSSTPAAAALRDVGVS